MIAGARDRDAAAGVLTTVRWVVAALLVLAAALLFLVRAPSAFRDLRSASSAASSRGALDGALAGADSLEIDNTFVQVAATLPPTARYAVLVPSSPPATGASPVSPLTLRAVPGFMLEVLLPRLPVRTPARGDYLLCYLCETAAWDARTKWLWRDGKGHAIGRVVR